MLLKNIFHLDNYLSDKYMELCLFSEDVMKNK